MPYIIITEICSFFFTCIDYLNFSKIDLFKLNQSFEDDIFTPNNIKNKKRIVEDRYEDTISTMNENSTINKNLEINMNIKNLNTSEKANIMDSPSSLCNYYGQSTFKKTSGITLSGCIV